MKNRDELRAALDQQMPGESEARGRTQERAQAAFEAREPTRNRLPGGALALALTVIAALIVVSLTPVGPAVGKWISETSQRLSGEVASPHGIKLPAPGRLLANTQDGPWVLEENGFRNQAGDYRDASWSPNGLYLVATDPNSGELVALTPAGHPRWSLRSPGGGGVVLSRWAPSGLRIAYLAGQELRIVDGDGSDDSFLADVAPVPPAWRPGLDANVVSYVNRSGFVVTANADTGTELWRTPRRKQITQLAWSHDGTRLAAVADDMLLVYNADGRLRMRMHLPTDHPMAAMGHVNEVAFSPTNDRLALARETQGGAANEVVLLSTDPAGWQKTVYQGTGGLGGLAWSPDGEWLLIAANGEAKWAFVKVADPATSKTVSEVQHLFGSTTGIPELAGWCCPLP